MGIAATVVGPYDSASQIAGIRPLERENASAGSSSVLVVKICSIIVCYRPHIDQLFDLCVRLIADGSTVVLVDNSEVPYLKEKQLPAGCELRTLGRNTGIAHAQNVGIAAAIAAGAEVLAFFDQDSTISGSTLTTLAAHLRIGKPDVVAPLCFDVVTGREIPAVRLTRFGIARIVRDQDRSSGPYPVDLVISSGTVATREAFQAAGTFDDGLFIDYVDHEWCLRCRNAAVPIRVVPSVTMRHRLGQRWIRLPLVTVIVHDSMRCYYQIRNPLLLLRKRHVPILYALLQILVVYVNRFLLIFFVDERRAYAWSYVEGLRDGIKGATGPRPGRR
jgi:rhamnosyltransferase